MEDNFFVRFFKKPPIVFPLVALFHVFLLGLHLWYTRKDFDNPANALEASWLIVAIFFMVFVCDLKRWAALGYIALTIVGLALQFLLPPGNIWHDVCSSVLFPFDLLLTVFLLFYYKRFY